MRFFKGTLPYMEKNAKDDKSFTLNAHVRDKWKLEKVFE